MAKIPASNTSIAFNKKLFDARLAANGFSLGSLATFVYRSPQLLNHVHRGLVPSANTRRAISDALGVSSRELWVEVTIS